MYSPEHYEELMILLEMGESDDFIADGYAKVPTIRLFEMWAKRVPPKERAAIYKTVPPRKWKALEYPHMFWAFEQKLLFPNEIACTVNDLWNQDIVPPDDLPELTLHRLSYYKSLPNTMKSARVVSRWVEMIKEESNNWNACARNVQCVQHLQNILKEMNENAPMVCSAVVRKLPSMLLKKINLPANHLQTEQQLFQKIEQLLKQKKDVQEEIKKLAAFAPSSVLFNERLVHLLRRHFEEKPPTYFKNCATELLKGKWKNNDVAKILPQPICRGKIQNLRNFGPIWAASPDVRKNLVRTGAEAALKCLSHVEQSLTPFLQWLHELQKIGVTKTDIEKYLDKHTDCDPLFFLMEVARSPQKVANNIEKNWSALEKIAPEKILGSLLVVKHLADKKPLSTQYSALSFNKERWDDEEIASEFPKHAKNLQDLQNNFYALIMKMNIGAQIKTATPAMSSKRKM